MKIVQRANPFLSRTTGTQARRSSCFRVSCAAQGYTKEITKEGDGPKPNVGDLVQVHYTGKLTDGKKFDSSHDRGQPLEFPVGRGMVIKGWDEGVLTMKVGEQAVLTCQPDYAYGAKGFPPSTCLSVFSCSFLCTGLIDIVCAVIPPNSVLVFDVELVGIKK